MNTDIKDDWVMPFIEEALRSLERGEGTTWVKGEALKQFHAKHPELLHGKLSKPRHDR